MLDSNQLAIEESTTETQTLDTWSERPDTATLTKGFSIPTYLPPYPDFIAADLPQRTQTTSTMTMTMTMATMMHNRTPTGIGNDTSPMQSNLSQQQQPHMRLHAYDSELKAQQLQREKQLALEREQLPRRQLSLPSRNVTVQAGQHAYLPCRLHQHSNKPLSWIRLRDEHIIAVDHTTFINDARFAALLQSSSNISSPLLESNNASSGNGSSTSTSSSNSLSWTLLIKYVSLQDVGWYECQLATEPKMSAKVQLFVITPKTELIGDKQRFVKAGSRVELHCIVRGTLEAPKYIVWYRGEQQVASENEAGGIENGWYTQIDRNIFGSTEHNRNTIGSLVIPVVRKTHSGNYTCEPENSDAVSIQLHVLSGEYSASAIMSTAAGLYRHDHGYNSLHQWLIFLLVALHKT
ncbi:GH17698 [Drosophila grimshawi]|uniref:GH17698 n=2 Tax=Drosophila grimshawi TaxID=7222 RepID=B4JSQ4_DROGR|nr:GH17698 [Drosophila grimshawi]